MAELTTETLPYKIADINLAEWGRKEIEVSPGCSWADRYRKYRKIRLHRGEPDEEAE